MTINSPLQFLGWACLLGMAGCVTTPSTWSDDDIVRYQTEKFDLAEYMHKTVYLGTHRGKPVFAEHPCGDVCPQYTRRIVRYDTPLEHCEQAGGAIGYLWVGGFAPSVEKSCVPPVLETLPQFEFLKQNALEREQRYRR